MEVQRGDEKVKRDVRRLSESSITHLHPLTKIPQRVVGINLFSSEYREVQVTKDNAEKVFKSFIKEHKDFLMVEPDELKLISIKQIRGKWYAKYQQLYHGIPVHKATVGLDASDKGKMSTYASSYHPKIDAPTEPKITLANAVAIAKKTYEDIDTGRLHQKDALKILYPVKKDKKVSYHLAWKFLIAGDEPNARIEKFFIVDAINGKILESYMARFPGAKIHGRVRGEIYPENPGDAVVTRDFEDEYVYIEYLRRVTTDETGRYEKRVPWYWPIIELFFNPECTFELKGPFVRVQNRNGNDYRVDRRCRTDRSCDHTWTDADRDHINVFYHMNKFHDWLKNQLNYDWWNAWENNRRFEARVNFNFNNAFAGSPMEFGVNPFARSSDVIYHECSHNMLFHLYEDWIGWPNSLSEGYAMDEGFSDYFACVCTNDSELGEGLQPVGISSRDLDNNEDYDGKDAYIAGMIDGHDGGEIIGGAAWDLRVNIIDAQGASGAKFTDNLIFDAHQILSNRPRDYFFSDPQESNLLSAIYMADDDNDDLVDGIPHFRRIHDAFYNHRLLRAVLYDRNSFDFSANLIGQLTGGDLYYSGGKFWANNLRQRGLKDLGDIGNVDLKDVIITSGGYTRFGVDAVEGHTYVSLAHEGEEGNHIVFRVNSIAADQSELAIEYCYRFQLCFLVARFYDLSEFLYEAARAEMVYEKLKFIGKGEDLVGLVDITDQKDTPVDEIRVPSEGLSLEVPVKEGHIYAVVSKRREYYIIFRVDKADPKMVRVEILRSETRKSGRKTLG